MQLNKYMHQSKFTGAALSGVCIQPLKFGKPRHTTHPSKETSQQSTSIRLSPKLTKKSWVPEMNVAKHGLEPLKLACGQTTYDQPCGSKSRIYSTKSHASPREGSPERTLNTTWPLSHANSTTYFRKFPQRLRWNISSSTYFS